MPGQEFPVYSGFITVSFTLVYDGVEEYSHLGPIDKGFWDPHTDTEYDSAE